MLVSGRNFLLVQNSELHYGLHYITLWVLEILENAWTLM